MICIEKKLLLSGEVKEYRCELVQYRHGFGILRYTIDRHYDIAGIHLHPGNVTLALYWTDRPYTLYTWRPGPSGSAVYYFNIADLVTLRTRSFAWRDLTVDILVYADGSVRILDEHELPPDLDPGLLLYIDGAKKHILENRTALVAEAEFLLTRAGTKPLPSSAQ